MSEDQDIEFVARLGRAIQEFDTPWLVEKHSLEKLHDSLGNPLNFWAQTQDPLGLLAFCLGIGPATPEMLLVAIADMKYHRALKLVLARWEGGPLSLQEYQGVSLRDTMLRALKGKRNSIEMVRDFSRAAGYSEANTARDILKAGSERNSGVMPTNWQTFEVSFRFMRGMLQLTAPSSLQGTGIIEYTYNAKVSSHGRPFWPSIKQHGTLEEVDWLPELARKLIEQNEYPWKPEPVPEHLLEPLFALSPQLQEIVTLTGLRFLGHFGIIALSICDQVWRINIFDYEHKKYVLGFFETQALAERALVATYGCEQSLFPQPL